MVATSYRRCSSASSNDDRSCDDATKRFVETIKYIKEGLHGMGDGPEKESMLRDHCINFGKLVGILTVDLAEVRKAMKVVKENTTFLGPENVKVIRKSISRSSDKCIPRKIVGNDRRRRRCPSDKNITTSRTISQLDCVQC